MSLVWNHSFPCKNIVISRWVSLTRRPRRIDPTWRPSLTDTIRRPKWVRQAEKPLRARPPANLDMPDRPNGSYRPVVLVKFINLVWLDLSKSLARLGPIRYKGLPSPSASLDRFVHRVGLSSLCHWADTTQLGLWTGSTQLGRWAGQAFWVWASQARRPSRISCAHTGRWAYPTRLDHCAWPTFLGRCARPGHWACPVHLDLRPRPTLWVVGPARPNSFVSSGSLVNLGHQICSTCVGCLPLQPVLVVKLVRPAWVIEVILVVRPVKPPLCCRFSLVHLGCWAFPTHMGRWAHATCLGPDPFVSSG